MEAATEAVVDQMRYAAAVIEECKEQLVEVCCQTNESPKRDQPLFL